MRIAALSDIHSNIYALKAVIGDLETRGVDQVVNLGDILYGPIAPRQTFECLMEYDFITIRGNQDRQIYEADPKTIESNPTLQFILEDLTAEALEWMKNLPATLQLNPDVFLCHGSPDSDLTYLLENIESGLPQVRQDGEILKLISIQKSQVILCGHTHIPRSITTSTGQQIINPGSVGLPAYFDVSPRPHWMENFSPYASYSILENLCGLWRAQHIKVPYDNQQAAQDAKRRNRQDWEYYLTTGRAQQPAT
ncbi:metallophosphoesterase family protein [Microbulbifer epialgicus]|uniref:Metallophosphoesterase n=1 Tax=Microbulbifer epialgicus TaxID=393907 RepID=A0ABV4NWP5_9GAMM